MVTVKGDWVEFRFYRPQAGRVDVVGDFNGWQEGQLAMSRSRDGNWTATVKLPAGTYRFRYRADGQWFTDYAAFGIEQGPLGIDSIVWVAPPSRQSVGSGADHIPA